ncbi:MAG: ThuA domain-containing protein [Clostridia bacterium]|nr:ThuA domain-containing protein [Clostridia bacterium]
MNVLVWNEFKHEKESDDVKVHYPDGIHKYIAGFLQCDDINVTTATLDDPECGLTQEVLDNTDVIIWWGHMAHKEVPDEIAQRVKEAVLSGMGAIFLHSAHHSKPFKLLMGTSCNLGWREDGDWERLWIAKPSHPIAQGLGKYIDLPHEEVYAEPFDIPNPDELVMISGYEGSEVFRAGCCYFRGMGKVFYFQPGHETYPTYHDANVQTVIKNAVRWAAPGYRAKLECPRIEKIPTLR